MPERTLNLKELGELVEDKAVEYLNATRLDSLEEMALNQLNKSANNGYVRLHKLEFSALLDAVRGLHRRRQQAETDLETAQANNRRTICVYCGKVCQFDELVTWEMLKESMMAHLEECPTHPVNLVVATEALVDRLAEVLRLADEHINTPHREFCTCDSDVRKVLADYDRLKGESR